MYLSHFGLTEQPFRITPHTEFFFSGANRGATLEALLYAITHDEGIVKVTGEVGSGKTMLCRVLVERLPKNVETIYLATPSLSRDEILHVIAADLQVEARGERMTIMLRALQEKLIKLYAAGRRVVVLIDEAHAMPLETLEEVRLLSNLESNRHKLLQIVLFGQPELDEHLAVPNMRQLRERITHSFRLEPLIRADIDSYVDFRMRAAGYRGPKVFAPPAMKLIAKASEGLTRRINILADKSLLAAFAEGAHGVTATHVRAAIKDSEFGRRGIRWPAAARLLAAGVAGGVAVGAAVHFLAARTEPPPAATVSSGGSSATVAAVAAPGASTNTPHAERVPASLSDQVGSAPASAPVGSPPASPPAEKRLDEATPVEALTKAASETSAAKPVAPPPAPVAPLGKLSQERFAATQQWLRSVPGGQYTIQLMTIPARDAQAMERFLKQAGDLVDLQDVRVYSMKVNGQQHYGVTYGLYPSVEETITAMGDLPSQFKSRGPYHRSIGVMRRQNQE
jgi:type II secretory pathway predicted ATPase ExeA/septal ring-binding cell division protein DamX